MPTPPKTAILGVWKNKMQLNKLISDALLDPDFYIPITLNGHSLTLAGVDDVPIEIAMGVRSERTDLLSRHEEADTIIVQHAISRCEKGENVKVISDDTDVFILLLHFYASQHRTSALYMVSPIADRSIIDMRATVERNRNIASAILAMHALTGTDTVAATYNIGKNSALKALQTINLDTLSNIGNAEADINDVCNSATVFLIACFGKAYAGCKSMTQCRIKMWKKKTGAGTSIKLCNLPPTSEATAENIKRAHYQVALWLNSMSGMLPPLRPIDLGWEQDGSVLKLRTITLGTKLAPDEILEMVRCGCEKSACKGANCKCSQIGCTVFCFCEAALLCLNPLTKKAGEGDDVDDGDDEQYVDL